MTLDDDRCEPDWLRVARIQQAEERAARLEELRHRDECESPEAVAAHWRGAFKSAAGMPWRALPDQEIPGYDRRCFGVEGDRDTPEPVDLPGGMT